MDPTLKTRTVSNLKLQISGFAPQMRKAAKYVLDHPTDFGLDPIRDTARKAGVSTYTLVNMAKMLGFDGYEALRGPFRHALVAAGQASDAPDWLGEMRQQGAMGQTFAQAADNGLSIVKRSLERQDLDEVAHAVDVLLKAETVYVTAVRASYAMAYYLHYVGRMALPSMELIPRHMNSALDDLNDAKPGDVLIAITVTPYSRETIEACRFAAGKGVKLVFITDSEVVTSDLSPDATLVTSVVSTHNFGCFSGMMALIETLIALLMQRGGDAAAARINSYGALRLENNAYWDGQKKH